MKQWSGLVYPIIFGVLLGGAVSIGPASGAEERELPMQELRAFAEIFGRIKEDYVEEVDDRELLEHAIRGMLSGLDPHSVRKACHE